jgi:hypothetical protein
VQGPAFRISYATVTDLLEEPGRRIQRKKLRMSRDRGVLPQVVTPANNSGPTQNSLILFTHNHTESAS